MDDNHQQILYLVAGANGSGKSTLASELLPDKNLYNEFKKGLE